MTVVAAILLAAATALEVQVPGPAGKLAGTLTLPDRGRPPFPAVVTLTGSGAHHRDGNRTPDHPYRPFRDIADALAGCGVATLRLDDRGVGSSTGDASAATAKDTAADAQAALRFLVHFSTGPGWTAGKPPQEQPRFGEHGANLARLRKQGRIALGARFAEKGMIVVRFPTEEAARAEIAADPGVMAGTFVFDIAELRTFYDACLDRRAAGSSTAATPQPAAPAPLPSVTLPPPLARVLADYEAAWQAKDPAALAALFAEDGFVLAGGKPPVRGRAQIEKHYVGQGGPLALRALAYATDGATGYIIGGYGPARGEPDTGKFTLTLRKGDGGRWLIMSDMDNGNAPRTGG